MFPVIPLFIREIAVLRYLPAPAKTQGGKVGEDRLETQCPRSRLLTKHCPGLTAHSRQGGKRKRPKTLLRRKAGTGQVARGDRRSKRKVITFEFRVPPRLITTTGHSCWEKEAFSH